MKLIIVDETELLERGSIQISNKEMDELVSMLEKWGIDFESFGMKIQRFQDEVGDCPAGTNWASRPEYQSREA